MLLAKSPGLFFLRLLSNARFYSERLEEDWGRAEPSANRNGTDERTRTYDFSGKRLKAQQR